MAKKLIVSGVGCSLVDRLYNNISFSADNFISFLSKEKSDGGLTPGHLVFKEEFEEFDAGDLQSNLEEIISERSPDKVNIGGPAIVSLIHAAQMTDNRDCEYHFYGGRGADAYGDFIISLLRDTPLIVDNYILADGDTPTTVVLSDPDYDQGNGERIFINSIGVAWEYSPDKLNGDFFSSDVVIFGGTALVPLIHDHMTELLEKAKSSACITIVNTVYDFRNEKADPNKKWPLGKSDESYSNIDLLMMDMEEALRLSGKSSLNEAMKFFSEKGTGAVIVTSGTENINVYSKGTVFKALEATEMPISSAISEELKRGSSGDTTGCGDNFVGGVLFSLVSQIQEGVGKPDIFEACSWGIVSGGASCFYLGGMFEEENRGDKRDLIEPYFELYKHQIKGFYI